MEDSIKIKLTGMSCEDVSWVELKLLLWSLLEEVFLFLSSQGQFSESSIKFEV